MRRQRWPMVVGSVGLLVGACASSDRSKVATTSTSPAASATTVPPTSVVPSTTVAPRLALAPCDLSGESARCSTVSVPEDRSIAGGRTIALRVAVVEARNATSNVAPLVLLSGGPGGSAIDDAPTFLDRFDSLRADHDLVFIEQRGTGKSGAMLCDAIPLGGRGEAALFAAGATWAQECLDRALGDVSKYGTESFVDDLDEVLGELGYGAADVYGGSYGALAAQVLAIRHPDRVRTVVLDGVSLLGVPVIANMPRDSQRAFDLLVARCRADESCTAAYPDVAADLATVLSRLRSAPVQLPLTDPATGQPLLLDDLLAAQAVHAMLLFTETSPALPGTLRAAALGVYDYLQQAVAGIISALGTSRLAMYVTIRCSEPWAAPTPDDPEAVSYLSAAAADQTAFFSGVCSVWPKATVSSAQTEFQVTDVPVLLLVGEADPQNPPSAVDGAAAAMPNSIEVVAAGHGHGIVQSGCIAGLVQRFVAAGSAAGLDISCVAAMTPPPFVLPPS